jgi:uncharacterized protein (TIRG00374 family)
MAVGKKHIGRYILSAALTVLFMYLAFRGVKLSELWESRSSVSWVWVAVLFLGGILSHIARAWRWQYLLYPVKNDVTLRNSFSAVMIGYMVNNVLPRVGEVVRPYTLGRLEKISRSAAFGTVVIERVVDTITFMFILLVSLFFYVNSFGDLFPSFRSFQPYFLAGSVLFLVFAIVVFFKAEYFFSVIKKMTGLFPGQIRGKVDTIYNTFVSGFAIARYPGKFLAIAFSSLCIWGLYILLMYIPFFAFPSMVSAGLGFGAATLLVVVSGVAYAFPTPSAFGTYHSFTSFALTRLYHIDPVTALSFSILTHEVGYILTTGIGLYYFFRDHVRVDDAVNDSARG